ncbi:hypothetical protein N7495_005348 [Penicillium taxi]|uniref:uncharacterized protein n=1 Tax=Penicillium taxi TaxID=168475 RepID=UPI00254574A5|nr:uncharacterized protein N7495_005348 [Penicillium taxi]KAJ5893657.1 hypothetical protein N7495_005348 [Penicillium taxi]
MKVSKTGCAETGRPARACQECREKKKRCTHRDIGNSRPVMNISKTPKTRARKAEKEVRKSVESPSKILYSAAPATETESISSFPNTAKLCHSNNLDTGSGHSPQGHPVSPNYSNSPIPELPEDSVEAACHMAIHVAHARELECRLTEFRKQIDALGDLYTQIEAAHQAGQHALQAVNNWTAVWSEGL